MNAYKLETLNQLIADKLAEDLCGIGALAIQQGAAVLVRFQDEQDDDVIHAWCQVAYTESLTDYDRSLLGL